MICPGCNNEIANLWHPQSRRLPQLRALWWRSYYQHFTSEYDRVDYSPYRPLACLCGHRFPRSMFKTKQWWPGYVTLTLTDEGKMEQLL